MELSLLTLAPITVGPIEGGEGLTAGSLKILKEDGTGDLLMETGDYLLLEVE